jgi:hypothetical protein
MIYRSNHKASFQGKRVIVIIAICVLIILGTFIFNATNTSPDYTPGDDVLQKNTAENGSFDRIEGRYLFTGTIVLARGVEQQAQLADGSYDYSQPFSRLDTLNPEEYDAWVTDLECPITNTISSFRQQVETLIFNCRPEWIPSIQNYFKFINLANNHSGDLGRAAFEETQQRLDDANLAHFGHYDPTQTQDTCQILPLPVRLISEDVQENAVIPVTFCGWHYFTRSPQESELDIMNNFSNYLPVFAFTHAGQEYLPRADESVRILTRSLIDRGAEFVINNNPHWVQDTEAYKGKLIVYSTGNFIFDQLETETNRAANIDTTISLPYDENVKKWITHGKDCLQGIDTCREIIEKYNLEKLNLSYEYAVVASQGGYRELTRRATPSVQAAVEERMNWQSTLTGLEASIDQ